jgi:hypothetical protein
MEGEGMKKSLIVLGLMLMVLSIVDDADAGKKNKMPKNMKTYPVPCSDLLEPFKDSVEARDFYVFDTDEEDDGDITLQAKRKQSWTKNKGILTANFSAEGTECTVYVEIVSRDPVFGMVSDESKKAKKMFAEIDQDIEALIAESEQSSGETEAKVDPDAAAKETIATLKAVQLACEAYAVDWGVYPAAESMAELRPLVTPTYMHDEDLPDTDGFGNPLAILSDSDGYLIGSAGPDGLGNTDDDFCLREDLRFSRESCGLKYQNRNGEPVP